LVSHYQKEHSFMESEKLKIFDEERNPIGIATREEVHRLGYWHEAFHCWFVSKENDIDYLFLQLRSESKKDYPNLLDITAAGHLLADETVYDGVREIKEEIGIDVSSDELNPLGIMEYCVTKENFIDNEMANVFLYKSHHTFEDFTLQEEEVSGMGKVAFYDFVELWEGKREIITIQGYKIINGKKVIIDGDVGKDQFVPHPIDYYQTVIRKIKDHL
jgi:isopentenyldiphosphate isomerase